MNKEAKHKDLNKRRNKQIRGVDPPSKYLNCVSKTLALCESNMQLKYR